jgi:hypothetical protein
MSQKSQLLGKCLLKHVFKAIHTHTLFCTHWQGPAATDLSDQPSQSSLRMQSQFSHNMLMSLVEPKPRVTVLVKGRSELPDQSSPIKGRCH